MARSEIPMVINLRQNKNDDSTAYGKYFAEVDSKEPLNLKGLAKHMTEHGKISSLEMCQLVKLGKANLANAVAGGPDAMINGIRINFNPENSKGEKLTSRALKDECVFTFGYLVESEKRTVGGKEKRFQKKTPLSYVLAPEADQQGNG